MLKVAYRFLLSSLFELQGPGMPVLFHPNLIIPHAYSISLIYICLLSYLTQLNSYSHMFMCVISNRSFSYIYRLFIGSSFHTKMLDT